jgi:hypothetical protein
MSLPLYQFDDLAGRINHMLGYANPQGEVAEKLRRLLTAANEKCILGPVSLRFLSELERRMQNIECCSLSPNGVCGLAADMGGYKRCEYRDRFAACEAYEPVIPTDAKPLKAIGITQENR